MVTLVILNISFCVSFVGWCLMSAVTRETFAEL